MTTKRVQWGVKIGRTIRPLPYARGAADAAIYAAALRNASTKAVVVYRNSEEGMWRSWNGEDELPTQLTLDLPRPESRRKESRHVG
ncbi:hypothetical protein [Nocardia transvalensis]|uniref:hypothetical protein n=1 Tax=Nocardia transvalensis TaxID=37333 RepID=UPI001893D7A3|nr:hypothetical protein [Nocardia transvalensis]MBF6334238.1 hypothetical protein [Nocardia transvalensis]